MNSSRAMAPSHFLPTMNGEYVFDIIYQMEGFFTTFLTRLDFPTRWSFLCTSKDINTRTKTVLTFLCDTNAIPSLWDAYLEMRKNTYQRTEGFKFRGYKLCVPFRAYYTARIDGKMKLQKDYYETFLLHLTVFHNYVGIIDWFFSDIQACDAFLIMEIIGVMGNWQILEYSTLGRFLACSDKPNANRFYDSGMATMVAQRGDVEFWNKIVAADRKGRMQASLQDVKENFWLKRQKRDASPKRKQN